MKFYSVIDNGIEILNTTDELKALRSLREIMEKHDVSWGWVDDKEIK